MSTEGPVCIVTGSNAGIGKETALQLAQHGAVVVMACRNAERGERARSGIVEATGSDTVHLMSLDTSSMRSVRAFAAAFEERFERLDALINNAGNFDLTQKQPVLTEEGFENIFATNYLGPWLLTHLLLPRLRASAPSRVINVGSKGLLAYPFLGVEFDNLDGSRKFSPARAYYHSKLASLVHTVELSRRLEGSGVVANMVRVPAVQVAVDRLASLPAWQLGIYKLKRRQSLTPARMAETYTALAVDGAWAEASGQYVDENQRAVSVPKKARDASVSAELWSITARLVGVEAD